MDIWEGHELIFHYTSEAGLVGILSDQTIYATHYKFLNDRQEIYQLLPRIRDHVAPHIQRAITRVVQGNKRGNDLVSKYGGLKNLAAHEAEVAINALYKATFKMQRRSNFYEPFIVSFCGHDGDYEKDNGLLSQWRAYGGKSGFAIAFETKKFWEILKDEMERFAYNSVHFSDVVYDGDTKRFEEEFAELLTVLEKTLPELFQKQQPDLDSIFGPFINAATRFKHRGFHEEQEVRCVLPPISAEWLTSIKNDQPEDFKKLEGKGVKKINYRPDMVPYILIGENFAGGLPIKYIIVGPDANKDSKKEKLEKFLELSGRKIEVKVSDTPFV